MSCLGYTSTYKVKDGTVREGSAIFVRNAQLLAEHSFAMKDIIFHPYHEDLYNSLKENSALFERFTTLGTVAVMGLFRFSSENNSGPLAIVANTHLHSKHWEPNVRIIQAVLLVREAARFRDECHAAIGNNNGNNKVGLILCGDLNANPKTAAYDYLRGLAVPSTHADWGETGFHLEAHNLGLFDALGHRAYSNFVGGFSGCLDYVFADGHFETVNVVPPPPHDRVVEHTALPSVVFPSDHIAQIVDLRWISQL